MHALARVRQSRAAGLLEEPLRVLAAELERLPQSRHLGLGRVSQGEPEQLVVGEALERALPVLDLLGLSLVEQEYRQHVPLFSGNRPRFPVQRYQRCRPDPPARGEGSVASCRKESTSLPRDLETPTMARWGLGRNGLP